MFVAYTIFVRANYNQLILDECKSIRKYVYVGKLVALNQSDE